MIAQQSTTWHKVSAVSDFPMNGGACAKLKGKQIAIFNFSNYKHWYACQNLCPHKRDNVLARGLTGTKDGIPKVACPHHKKTFSLTNGECLSGENYKIQIYNVRVEKGFVYIGLQE